MAHLPEIAPTRPAPPSAWDASLRPGAPLRLYTALPTSGAQALLGGQAYRTDPALSAQSGCYDSPEFYVAYTWITEQLRALTPDTADSRPPGPALPVWAWLIPHQGMGARRPDLRRIASGQDHAVVGFDAPAHTVLLSDFELWHLPLNGAGCLSQAEDQAVDEFLEARGTSLRAVMEQRPNDPDQRAAWDLVQRSWQRCLSPDWTAPGWSREAGDPLRVQACVWEIRPEQVVEVKLTRASRWQTVRSASSS